MIGMEGARLLREKRVEGRRPHRRKSAKEAPGPPAESECLEFQSTYEVLQFDVGNLFHPKLKVFLLYNLLGRSEEKKIRKPNYTYITPLEITTKLC
jgi:hypothetical protein